MLKSNTINPKWILIAIILMLSFIILNNKIAKTFCEEETNTQNNNLEIESESVEFETNTDENEMIKATSGQADFIITKRRFLRCIK